MHGNFIIALCNLTATKIQLCNYVVLIIIILIIKHKQTQMQYFVVLSKSRLDITQSISYIYTKYEVSYDHNTVEAQFKLQIAKQTE